jgi:predicted phosphatase
VVRKRLKALRSLKLQVVFRRIVVENHDADELVLAKRQRFHRPQNAALIDSL